MNSLAEYLTDKLIESLLQHRVVVWYDPKKEFADFVNSLGVPPPSGSAVPAVTPVQVGSVKAHFVRFEGSFYGVKFAVEPLFAGVEPEPILIYLPGAEHDTKESVLMEIEKAGTVFEPQFKRTARLVLKEFLSDGEIDEIIERPSLTYADVVHLLEQAGSAEGMSILKTVFREAVDNATLLAAWLANHIYDAPLAEKQGRAELYKLIQSRLGLELGESVSFEEARDKTVRFVLVNEFRGDLQGIPAPESISRIPEPALAEQKAFCHKVADALRKQHAQSYAALADKVETELALGNYQLDAVALGAVDTFRFEERALLARCGQLIADRSYRRALEVTQARADCFWVRQDLNRQAQWEACRLMAQLGRKAQDVIKETQQTTVEAAVWVKAYTEGWWEADQLHRKLESWVAQMPSDPETEQALAMARGDHEGMLREQSGRFSRALQASGWTVPGALMQTHVYSDVVAAGGGTVAYFLMDALRFEMGVEFARLLNEAQELSTRPAVAVLPTITTVGMAALLPGAESSYSVVEHKGKVAARVDTTVTTSWNDRWKYFKARVPDAVEYTLEDALKATAGKLRKEIEHASVVVVRSQELDSLGERSGASLARQSMDVVLNNAARVVRKLAAAGVGRFVITADHGHLFGEEREEDMQADAPGGQTIEIKRRCWVGRGGQTPVSTVRVSGAQLGYDTDLEFVFPTGMAVLPARDGLQYHHGGASLQELIIPVISFRMAAKTETKAVGKVEIKDAPHVVTNRMFSIKLEAPADLLAEPIPARVLLVAGEATVGKAGMALEAQLDRDTGVVRLAPGKPASVGMVLEKADCAKLKVLVLNADTEALLAQSEEIPVKLAI